MNEIQYPSALTRKFAIRREIARGNTCVILSAEHKSTGRAVAIKQLLPDRVHDENLRARLRIEARALEIARHPNVVEILDCDEVDGAPFLVLEMLEGRTLRGILTSRPRLPIGDAVAVGRQLCDAAFHMHSHGLVHRHLHPGHVMLARGRVGEEVVKIIDFSLALLPGPEGEAGSLAGLPADSGKLQPEYASPELLMRGDVDHRADIYSLGATVFECLSGATPPGGTREESDEDASAQAASMLRELKLNLPTALADVVARAMATQRSARHPDAHSFGLLMLEGAMDGFEPSGLLGPRSVPPPQGIAAEFAARYVPTFPPPPRPVPAVVEQRRKNPRQPYVTPIRLQLTGGTLIDGHSEDISEGGLLMVASRSFAGGGHGEVRFATPMTGKVARLPVHIRWVRDNRDRVAAGLEFQGLPEATRLEIAEYVRLMDRRRGSSSPPKAEGK
ncbi:MAG: protein kinase [Deltaproteobacteria bacterium]|nr:protein kinase [Deltaproteobacteria bacterium]